MSTESLCFADGEAIARKAAQVVLVARPSPPDAAGTRQRQTLRAGSIWLKPFGFRLGRGATTTFTETLDLEPMASGRVIQYSPEML